MSTHANPANRDLNPDDPRSALLKWKTLEAAQRSTKKTFGDDARFFHFYESSGGWRRAVARPSGSAVIDPSPKIGRAVVRLDPNSDYRIMGRDRQALLGFKKQPGYVYHVTTSPAFFGIRDRGLQAGAFPGIGTEIEFGYEDHSRGGVFFTDAPGLPYWLANQQVKDGEIVLLRTKDPKCSVDEHGTRDAREYLRKKTTSYRCTGAVAPDRLEVWDQVAKAWRPVPTVQMVTMREVVPPATAGARRRNVSGFDLFDDVDVPSTDALHEQRQALSAELGEEPDMLDPSPLMRPAGLELLGGAPLYRWRHAKVVAAAIPDGTPAIARKIHTALLGPRTGLPVSEPDLRSFELILLTTSGPVRMATKRKSPRNNPKGRTRVPREAGALTFNLSHGNTWSVVHEKSGMEVGLVTGRRRAAAAREHMIEAQERGGLTTWQEFAHVLTAWRQAHPRPRRDNPHESTMSPAQMQALEREVMAFFEDHKHETVSVAKARRHFERRGPLTRPIEETLQAYGVVQRPVSRGVQWPRRFPERRDAWRLRGGRLVPAREDNPLALVRVDELAPGDEVSLAGGHGTVVLAKVQIERGGKTVKLQTTDGHNLHERAHAMVNAQIVPREYRVAYTRGDARRVHLESEHNFTLAQAKAKVKEIKRRGMNAWVEKLDGEFVPVPGVTRRPGFIEDNPIRIRGPQRPAPHYISGDTWAYRGWQIDLSDMQGPADEKGRTTFWYFNAKPLSYNLRARHERTRKGMGWAGLEGPASSPDKAAALQRATFAIDVEERFQDLYDTAKTGSKDSDRFRWAMTAVRNSMLSLWEKGVTLNRANLAREIEERRRQSYQDAVDFTSMPLPERLAMMDDMIEVAETHDDLWPNPSRPRAAKVWYHGGPEARTDFRGQRWDRDRTTSSLNEEGPGVYFTDKLDQAASYGPYVVQLQLPGNFKVLRKKKPTLAELRHIYEAASEQHQEVFLSNWSIDRESEPHRVDEVLGKYARQTTLHDALVSLYGDMFQYDADEWIEAVRSLGYDGVIVPKNYGIEHLIVWAPEKIAGFVHEADVPADPDDNPATAPASARAQLLQW